MNIIKSNYPYTKWDGFFIRIKFHRMILDKLIKREKRKLKVIQKRVLAKVMAFITISSLGVTNTISYVNAKGYNKSSIIHKDTISIIQSKGYLEGASVQWSKMENASGYNVYYKLDGESDLKYKQIDDMLIRQYPSYFRADILGLSEGNYTIKVIPIIEDKEDESLGNTIKNIEVKNHKREGFAFSQESLMKTSSGGYDDNGTVKDNAQIVYINSENINTVKLDVITNSKGSKTTCTGIVDILSKRSKGYDKTPLIIRMIGKIDNEDINGLNSSGYLQLKGLYNVTFEGVGEDSTVYGWGFLIRDSRNIELRNVGIMLFPDDAISLDTGNENIWVHNNDIFYGKAGSDADQAKGDGSADIKGKSTYVTVSYNHFYDSGKASLCGMSDTEEFFVTYHHNWFDHSDSRHPRIRVGTVHIYNNYFDGNSKYGVGVTKGSSAFVEANDFRNAKYPMIISLQGSDISGNSKGNFSSEPGGMIKAYNNNVSGETKLVYANEDSKQFDAYLAKSRGEKVSSTYKTVSGGNTYNNFDTSSNMYKYTPDNVEDVRKIVTSHSGRVNGGDFTWKFISADDTSYSVNIPLMNAIKGYESKLISIGGGSIVVPPTTPEIPPQPPVEDSKPVEPEPPVNEEVSLINHNFTTDGKHSEFFTIKGSISNTKGTVNYNDLILTDCLKIESSTSIKFKIENTSKLTLVFNSGYNKKIKINGNEYSAKNGILEVNLQSGEYTITKGDTGNLYYIGLEMNI